MYRLINQHSESVLAELAGVDLPKYMQLRELLGKVDVASDTAFQQLYRDYWRMNVARLGASFYTKYFRLLAQGLRSGTPDIGTIVRNLAKVDSGEKESLQFSFATKLVHMVDPHTPVYDSFVAAFFFYVAPTNGRPFDKRLPALLKFHGFLQREYERVIHKGLLNQTIRAFRAGFPIAAPVCDERVIDWLLWGWVRLLRGEAQQRGTALYE